MSAPVQLPAGHEWRKTHGSECVYSKPVDSPLAPNETVVPGGTK